MPPTSDIYDRAKRSEIMSRISGRNTEPERAVRRALWGLGCRYRLHRADLPGRPDIVLPKYHLAIFVHGCFWHGHRGCRRATLPRTNTKFWTDKIGANERRDRRSTRQLRALGWRIAVIWECRTRKPDVPARTLVRLLASP
jgi:DNA mismatch endonuclease (patch repair protein)